jgi:DNA helicase-2/ATP-dependent DNA helicase PcrA
MRELYLTHAESRRLYGREESQWPSRFLREIPAERLEEVRARGGGRRSGSGAAVAGDPSHGEAGGFTIGQRVMHPKFGEGVILNSEGRGAAARIQVNFEGSGMKWLVLAYAPLEPIR